MTEHDALYAAVCQHHADDTPRLIFADWLDENGERGLAEFVRVQCELARIGHQHPNIKWVADNPQYDGLCPQCVPLFDRERDLFKAHGAEWFGANATLSPPNERERRAPGWWCVIPARGFPAHWYGPWSRWVGGPCDCPDGGDGGTGWGPPTCLKCNGTMRIPGAWERAWKPSWMMECDACKGYGRLRVYHSVEIEHVYDCPTCHGEDRIPRPMPGDAWPVTEVTLTDMPEFRHQIAGLTGWVSHQYRLEGRDTWHIGNEIMPSVEEGPHYVVRSLLTADYPDITFHLPGVRETVWNPDYEESQPR